MNIVNKLSMHEYSLEIIAGTSEYVKKELIEKYPNVEILVIKNNIIIFSSVISNIDEFRNLYSPLRITNSLKKTRNLFRREWRSDVVPAGINPALAYIMCQIAKVSPVDTIFDPFCGGGTIPLTAKIYFRPLKVFASDISGKAIDIVEKNIKNNVIFKDLVVFRSNVSTVKLTTNKINKVITNLPFGIRTGTHNNNILIYKNFMQKMDELLQLSGIIVLLTQEKKLIVDTFSNTNFKHIKTIDVSQGGLTPSIYVFKKYK